MVLEIKNLGFAYENKQIFSGLNLNLRSGDTLGILGRNGIGKSTLLKLILGVLKFNEGEILLDGNSLKTMDNKARAKLVGYVPQSEHSPFSFKVSDMILMGINANIGLFERPKTEHWHAVERAAQIVGVSEYLNLSVDELSGGMMQLAMIARALVLTPKLLIMDEPTSYLDISHQNAVLNLIKKLSNEFGMCIIFTSHYPDHVLVAANKTLLLNGVNGFKFGNTGEILTDENLNELFGLEFTKLQVDNQARLIPRWRVM